MPLLIVDFKKLHKPNSYKGLINLKLVQKVVKSNLVTTKEKIRQFRRDYFVSSFFDNFIEVVDTLQPQRGDIS